MQTDIERVVELVKEAGVVLSSRFSAEARPMDEASMLEALRANDEASLAVLQAPLLAMRPGSRWVEGSLETSALPSGDFWAVDAVEGNINHVHGAPEWCVTVTLIRDGVAQLAVVHQPIGNHTWTAVKGHAAFADGVRLQGSRKTSLNVAIAATGQAEPRQTETFARFGQSMTAMLSHALLVRATVPTTFPLLALAEGRVDVFWQLGVVLPGVAAGMLIAKEAGAVATSLNGAEWKTGDDTLLVGPPVLHALALEVLRLVPVT